MRIMWKLAVGAGVLAGALMTPSVATASTFTITGSMEGNIQISNGDDVAAGYVFSVQGSHPDMSVEMANASVVFSGSCSNGGTDTLTVPLKPGPFSVAAGDNSWIPTGDEASPASFEGSVVANVCGGSGRLDASKGATFSGDLQSNVTANQVAVRFHYRDPNAKGKGNFDCSASTQAASVCGASWSGTAKIQPSTCSTSGGSNTCSPPCTPGSPGSNSCSPPCTPGAPGSNSCSPPCTPGAPGSNSCSPPCTSGTTASGTCSTPPSTPATSPTAVKHKRKAHKKHRRHVKAKKISRPPRSGVGFTG
jgi:hypothetical protein